MKSMKKVLALVSALALAISMTACGGGIERSSSTATSAASGTEAVATGASQIVVGYSMTYSSLDPAHCYEADAEMILKAAYNTLVTTEPGDESELLPCVASDWTISDDGLTYVFNINKGIKFTTGKELTAADVAYCFNRVAGIKGNPSFLMDTVDSVEATGDYELTVKLNTVNPALLSIFSRGFFAIYDSEVAAANGGTGDESDTLQAYFDANPSIGSGAYTITSYTSGTEVVLEKNADATVRTGNVEKFIVKNVADANTQQMELEAGDIDFALDLTADQTALLTDNDNVQLVTSSTYDIFFLMLNASEQYGKELANPLVREAINYAIDYDGLCMLAGNGAFVPGGIIPEGFLGNVKSTATHDVEKAKELLAEAGYADGFSFDCGVIPDMAPDGVSFMMCAEKIQSDLAEAGITMNIASQEVSVYLEGYRDGTQQAVISQWGPDYYDSNNQLAFLPGNTVGLRAGWTADMAPELAELGKQASVETDDDARAKLFEDIQAEMGNDSPFVVYLQAGRTWAVSTRVTNIIPSSAYWLDFATLELA